MFMMFAFTTDSVGVIIPVVIREFHLNLKQGGAFHYVTMAALALAGVGFGHLADRLGHKRTILLGLVLLAAASYLFAAGQTFGQFLALLAVSGIAIGIFQTGALALIGDISHSSASHTSTMNAVEGFFGLGGIVGPAIVARLLLGGVSWKWLYVIAGALSTLLALTALAVRYPRAVAEPAAPGLRRSLALSGDPLAWAVAAGLFLYVVAECAVYVWMPTLLQGYAGPVAALVPYALAGFFILRAAGPFLGSWMLARWEWTAVLAVLGGAILACFVGALAGGLGAAVILLPLSGLFMSMLYPTLNSKGISCFPEAQHGSASGIFLGFTCLVATAGPLAMGAVGDAHGGARGGFVLAALAAALLFGGLLYNRVRQPARARLSQLDAAEHRAGP